jgi:hypothetical protein
MTAITWSQYSEAESTSTALSSDSRAVVRREHELLAGTQPAVAKGHAFGADPQRGVPHATNTLDTLTI